MALSFAFDPSRGETPETVKQRRAIAEALMGSIGRTNTVGEGIYALLTGIAAGGSRRDADAAETQGRNGVSDLFSKLFSGSNGGNVVPASFTPPTDDMTAAAPSAMKRYQVGPGATSFAPGGNEKLRRALLDTIAGPESAGRYNVMYGGKRFGSYADHPRVAVPITSGPNVGKTSSAAGKYQFLGKTWDQYRDKLGLKNFSPKSQDTAAWALASDAYRQKTGGNLEQVLASGDPSALANVGNVLSGTWTSLPGGIEAGTNRNKFVQTFNRNLGAPAPAQVASLDPAAGLASQAGQGGGALPQAPPPVQAAPAAVPQPQQVAQAAPAPAPPQQSGPDQQALIRALQNPWLTEGQRKVIESLLEQQFKRADPAYQVGLQKDQIELERLRNPVMTPADQAQIGLAREKFEFEKTPRTEDIQEYEYAKGNGYQGSFQDFVTTMKRAGAQSLTVNTGPTGIDYGEPEKGLSWARDPNGKVKLDERGAPIALPYQGGSVYTEGEQYKKKLEDRELNRQEVGEDVVLKNIDAALKQSESWMSTGLPGQLTRGIGGTPAAKLKALIDPIRANIGFDRLQRMRQDSPTGGALGQVAVQELEMLQATLGSLDPNAGPEILQDNLNLIKVLYERALKRNAQYGKGAPGGGASDSSPDADLEDALKKYGP